ncbi:hypothetical protein GGTG_13568 [Gaeumannomyces tritici R3-111a-1]|uniref:Uncharacterized protein n=1 Tax=Gaeumannomyces tritici (strain R3-111a-1) TaxID=644352 RepID=J3PJ87_GAET3|nr:hypothetical protein GGTG_13568 [Gaeumannomyces tritici R3-111a-1]EJT68859.1 hypothetical protein GGTG_13568 [Gaeumannomyces tritici R3-111a-1]
MPSKFLHKGRSAAGIRHRRPLKGGCQRRVIAIRGDQDTALKKVEDEFYANAAGMTALASSPLPPAGSLRPGRRPMRRRDRNLARVVNAQVTVVLNILEKDKVPKLKENLRSRTCKNWRRQHNSPQRRAEYAKRYPEEPEEAEPN